MPFVSGGPISNISENRGNTRRTTEFLHRSAITNVDKLATAALPTLADLGTGGSLVFSTNYKMAAAAGNRYGTALPSSVANITLAADAASTHQITATITAVSNAEWYDIFLSTDAAPKWVGRITAAQLAAGGRQITAVGTYDSLGANIAGTVNIQVVGTGVATTAAPFTINSAWTPQLITPINCAGYSLLRIMVKMSVTDLRSDPTQSSNLIRIAVFIQNSVETSFYGMSHLTPTGINANSGVSLLAETGVTISGASSVVVCICDNAGTSATVFPGQGASVDVYTQLA